jgi:hypothetical protein
MDKHLNLYYSYNPGDLSSPETQKQLENNLTRALITTIKNLYSETQRQFIERLIAQKTGIKLKSKKFLFDLQNTEHNVNKDASKYIIILQRTKSGITLKDLKKINEPLLTFLATQDNRDELQQDINRHLREGSDFTRNGITIKNDELTSILDLILHNIPDAWIIGEKETILIETKIGNNVASPFQIVRHITGKKGFNISHKDLDKGISDIKLVCITWEDVASFIRQLQKNDLDNKEHFLLNELLEYINMTAQVLDFKYIIDNEIDKNIHKDQFELLLCKLDNEIKNKKLPFERKKRKKSGLWEPYTLIGSHKEDPHYTVHFSDKEMSIYLTTRNMRQVKEAISKLQTYYQSKQNNTAIPLFRYYICQEQYRLVDWKQGQLHGEFQHPFSFYTYFSEIGENIAKICQILAEFSEMKIYKQFELGYSIQFYDFSKIDNRDTLQVRKLNRQLLNEPNEIVKIFTKFIVETKELFDIMNK